MTRASKDEFINLEEKPLILVTKVKAKRWHEKALLEREGPDMSPFDSVFECMLDECNCLVRVCRIDDGDHTHLTLEFCCFEVDESGEVISDEPQHVEQHNIFMGTVADRQVDLPKHLKDFSEKTAEGFFYLRNQLRQVEALPTVKKKPEQRVRTSNKMRADIAKAIQEGSLSEYDSEEILKQLQRMKDKKREN